MPANYVDFAIDFLAGGVSVTITKTIAAPIERVKLLLQTQDANLKIRNGEVPRYTGILNCLSRVRAEQGFLSLWRGNFTNCFRYVPIELYNFTMKDALIQLLPKVHRKDDMRTAFATSALSGFIVVSSSLAFIYPVEYARTRLSIDGTPGTQRAFTGMSDCLLKTYKSAGIRGLYGGFSANLMSVLPYRTLHMALHDSLFRYNPYRRSESPFIAIASKFGVAQLTTFSAGALCYPFDTLMRRLQMQNDIADKGQRLYKGFWDCVQQIVRNEGISGFYKGFGANVVRIIFSAVLMVGYQEAKDKYSH